MIEINMNSMDGVVLMTAGKKIEENIKVTPVASLILPEYDGAYELLVPTVSGVWVFNEIVTLVNETISQDIAFIYNADGDTATNITVDSSEVSFSGLRVYDDGFAEAYRTVDFGDAIQEVSEEFYAWLTANAVKQ